MGGSKPILTSAILANNGLVNIRHKWAQHANNNRGFILIHCPSVFNALSNGTICLDIHVSNQPKKSENQKVVA